MPPLLVYSQISRIDMITVISNGIPRSLKTNSWRTIATRNNLKEAPNILEIKNEIDPIYCEFLPNLDSKYSYIDVNPSL